MPRIRNLKGGIYRRPVDTPAGAAGWYAEITYEEFKLRRKAKGAKDNAAAKHCNWSPNRIILGPFETENEIREKYLPEFERLEKLSNLPFSLK